MTEYRFAEGTANEYILDESEIVSHNPVLAHTGKADARVSCQEIDHLKDLAQYKTRVTFYENDTAEWTGYLLNASVNERTGNMDLDLDGVALRLEETYPDYESLGGNIQYQSISLSDAIRDYWARTPFNATVYDQATEVVAQDEPLQSADTTTEWENATTPAATDPVVIQNGNLELAQTNYLSEGEDPTTSTGTDQSSVGDLSNGFSIRFDASGERATYQFPIAYAFPESAVSFYIRDVGSDTPEVQFRIDGSTVDTLPQGVANLALGWTDVASGNYSGGTGYSGGTLSAGTHTLEIEATSAPSASGGEYRADVVCLLDNRFNYTFDNTTDANGYLSGPELYPTFSFEADETLTPYNIESATVATTWNDITGGQAIAVSNDGGATYTSANNTSTLTADFGDAGRTAQTKFTLSRYGSRTTATPTSGFNGQVIQDYTLTADLNDLTVIDQLELSRSHFQNLLALHEYGDFVWTIHPGGGALNTLTVESFSKGSQTKPTPDALTEPANITSSVKAESYYNKIRLEGALQSDGTRPTATVKDQAAIDAAGREIAPGVLRDLSITTEAGATFRANALLSIAVDNNDRTGRIDAPAGLVLPGYSYTVDLGDGPVEKTLEEADLNASAGEYSGTYHFVPPATISETISELRRNATSFENQV